MLVLKTPPSKKSTSMSQAPVLRGKRSVVAQPVGYVSPRLPTHEGSASLHAAPPSFTEAIAPDGARIVTAGGLPQAQSSCRVQASHDSVTLTAAAKAPKRATRDLSKGLAACTMGAECRKNGQRAHFPLRKAPSSPDRGNRGH
jgi:hypothetical protein